MKVSDVMTKRVISIRPEATIRDAIKLMLKNHISGMPVINVKGKLVGILTEGDFLHRSETGTERRRSRWLDALFGPSEAAKEFVHSHGLKVKEVMSRNPLTVRENTPLDEVVHLMEHRNIKRLPVMRSGKVVGIISRANLMHALASLHRGARPPQRLTPRSVIASSPRLANKIGRIRPSLTSWCAMALRICGALLLTSRNERHSGSWLKTLRA